MEKNEIRGYEPLVEELKQLIHKKQYHFMELNFVYLRILHIFSLFLMIRCP